jgi:predicted enzyme related to lactoylglutathione lyase
MIITRDAERLLRFYTGLFGAEETDRHPEDGPLFYAGLRIGDSALGVVVDDAAAVGAPQRMLLSVDVADVDALLPRVEELGGRVEGPPNDMPWGQRVAHVQDPDGNAVNLAQQL